MIIKGRDAHCSSGSQRALLPIEIISVKSMDNNNCGFHISSREIDILSSCEEDFGSRNSFTSLLNSAVPPGGPPDPPAPAPNSLQQSLFDSIASYLDNINPRAASSHVESQQLRKGACFRRGPGVESHELHLDMESHSNNSSSDNNISPPPPLSSSLNAEAVAEHFDGSQWSHAAQTSRGNNNNNKNPTNGSVSGSVSASSGSRLSLDPASASKVGKKRSRASRRAPTTVLTTDTTNFRAMVQEFTGIPPAPFASPSPFQRNRLDFLGPRSLSGNPFLLRPFPHRTQTFPSAVPPPTGPFQLPPPGLLFQSLLHHNPPKDSISPNLLNKTLPPISEAHIKAGLLEDLGLNPTAAQALNNHVLPDLVPSDRRPAPAPQWSAEVPCKMPYNNSNRVGPDLGRTPTSNPEEGGAEPNNHHARADGIVDSWISSSDQTLDKLVQ